MYVYRRLCMFVCQDMPIYIIYLFICIWRTAVSYLDLYTCSKYMKSKLPSFVRVQRANKRCYLSLGKAMKYGFQAVATSYSTREIIARHAKHTDAPCSALTSLSLWLALTYSDNPCVEMHCVCSRLTSGTWWSSGPWFCIQPRALRITKHHQRYASCLTSPHVSLL
jgi:hypothetical protein